ncbi:MAG: hypothetical protein ACXWP6_17965 [Ktedonobacterales bacterium]
MAVKMPLPLREAADEIARLGARGGGRPRVLPGPLHRLERMLLRDTVAVDQHIREGRFQRSLALVAGISALLGGLEVTYEHYRGSYSQRIMYSPVLLSPPLLIAGVWGAFNRRVARTLLPLASLALLVDGVVGFFFHIRGIARKPGGWRIPVFNVIMGPPLFAPLLLGIGGFLGLIATFLRREDDPAVAVHLDMPRPRSVWVELLPRSVTREGIALEQHVREGRFQRILAAATAISALLNGIEALYAHYKNRFTYRIQWTPILLSPLIACAGFGAVWSRTLLPLTSLLAMLNGGIGFVYHVRGVVRRPGGLKLPLYNVLYGPPVFAPLLYAATGVLGLLASLLRRAD